MLCSFLLILYSCLQSLREKQKSVRENHGPSIKQMKMWNVSGVKNIATNFSPNGMNILVH